ncbi:unnamed protein product [Arctia plantaginis]|uniref:Major facilitator superfamily (MFS) profile domain-containing protein n=1 Tax=Arctia plantaginis TaxID=874455 RepID=A0A8S1AJU6_ARCPL|nr:unnamed protein product [Arctia plantaginis]
MEATKMKPIEFLVQAVSAVIVSCMAIQTGFVMAWPSYNVANFLSNQTVLGIPMSSLEISLLGGLPNLGGLLSMPLCGWAFNTIGRKYGTMLFVLPFIISWAIISLTNNHLLILIAVTIAGAGVAGQNVSNIFLSEIAHTSIRGAMVASTSCGYLLGILISFTMGGYLGYMTIVLVHLTTSVLTMLVLAFLPESPVFLLLVGKEEEAAKSLAFYRQLDAKSKEVAAEIINIKLTINPKLEKMLSVEDQCEKDPETADQLLEKQEIDDETEDISAWKQLLKSKSSQSILIIILIVTAVTILMGGIVLQVYAEPLFSEAVPTMSANQCAIFVALDSLVATVLCVTMIDKFGRKSLILTTSIGAGICAGLLGSQLQFHWAPHWFTVVLIYGYGFMFTAGCAVLPSVLASEVFLPEVS